MVSSSKQYRGVFRCSSSAKDNKDISFHNFPEKNKEMVYIDTYFGKELIDREKAWIVKLKMRTPVSEI